MGSKNRVEGRFKEIKVDIGRGVRKMKVTKTIQMDLNGVEVAPFGPKLCQNIAPRLRIFIQALLRLKKHIKKN